MEYVFKGNSIIIRRKLIQILLINYKTNGVALFTGVSEIVTSYLIFPKHTNIFVSCCYEAPHFDINAFLVDIKTSFRYVYNKKSVIFYWRFQGELP